jgi:hypothetical protein
MKQELFNHKIAYAALFAGLFGLTLLFFAVWPDRVLQRLAIVALCAFYALWGIMAHLHVVKLSRRVVYEYLGVSTLAGIILFFITF